MTKHSMTSLQRVLTALGFQEPDRVPFFLLVTMHGAKELGLTISDYFSRAENVVEGQLRMRRKYGHDCLYGFFYAPVEIEAWGGEVIYVEDGPPNSGEPFVRSFEKIPGLVAPEVEHQACLRKVLEATSKMKERVGDEAPIIGVVMSPFSLPVMQMGFERYLDLIFDRSDLFWKLMTVNEAFCVSWANAQLKAGATAICYFDPVSSTTVIPREVYLQTGFKVAKQTLSRIQGPTATHFASGRSLPIVDDVARTGTAAVGTSSLEDLVVMKAACQGRLAILGNLNGVEMRHWTAIEAERAVCSVIQAAGRGGVFVLSDNHGEIPWQVPESTLMAIAEAVHAWGQYPLDRTGSDE